MGYSLSPTPRWRPPPCSMRSKPASSSSAKRGAVSPVIAQKLARLQTIVAERVAWADQLAQIKRLHGWLLEVEHLLDASPAPEGEVVSNATVGSRLDAWRAQMTTQLTDGSLSELERECLTEFLQVLSNLLAAPGAVLRPGRLSPHQQRHGAQHSWAEARSIAGSVVARIGTPISYATGAPSPTPPGGSKTRPIASICNSVPPSWTVPTVANCDGSPLLLRASNPRAFVSVTSATAYSLPLSSAGPPLLSRHPFPGGLFQASLLLT